MDQQRRVAQPEDRHPGTKFEHAEAEGLLGDLRADGVPVLVVVSLRLWSEYPISGASFPLLIVEIACVGLTAALAGQVGQNLEGLRRSAVTALLDRGRDRSRPFATGQEEIDRLIRLRNTSVTWTIEQLREMRAEYKARFKTAKEARGL